MAHLQNSRNYLQAEQSLNTQNPRRRAFVEDETDIPFWKHIFDQNQVKIKIKAGNSSSFTHRGKLAVLSEEDSENLWLCVDSDRDYWLQDATETSKRINKSPFIFQTYVYAVENYQCYAPALQNVLLAATLVDKFGFNFEEFLQEFSEIVAPLWLYVLWMEARGRTAEYSVESFKSVFKDFKLIKEGNKVDLNDVVQRIEMEKAKFPHSFEHEIVEFKESLEKIGWNAKEAYLHIQGHLFLDKIVLPLLKDLYKEIRTNYIQKLLIENQRNKYKKSVPSKPYKLVHILETHKGYASSKWMGKIHADIQKAIESL